MQAQMELAISKQKKRYFYVLKSQKWLKLYWCDSYKGLVSQ